MTEGIVKQYVITRTYDVLYDLLSSVSDPLSRTQANFIKSSFPNPNSYKNCKGGDTWQYPLVVIEGANIERVPLSVDRAQTISKETVTTEIEVHARTSLERDQIAQDIMHVLYNNASSLSTGTLQNMRMMGSSDDIDFLGEVKVRIKRMTFQFQRVD